jgi:tRNA threonylcarbamoyladenosine biosynthesis protein TsaE
MPLTEPDASAAPDASIACVDEVAVGRFAKHFAAALPPRVMIALEGDLGAGKTTFVKMLASAVGINPAEVTSPTFTIVHLYEGPRGDGNSPPARLTHIDAYRLSGVDEVVALGWEELVAEESWLLVEWPERIEAALPAERIRLHIEITGESSRTLHLAASSDRLKDAVHVAAVGFEASAE